jgi:hypothetical protein
MARYFINLYLDSFVSQDSGDITGDGEFYFKCNGRRYPNKGVINLSKGELFDPKPNPTLYTSILDEKEKNVKIDVEVWEDDPGRDDKFIDHVLKYPIKAMADVVTLQDKKKRCTLKLNLSMTVTDKW